MKMERWNWDQKKLLKRQKSKETIPGPKEYEKGGGTKKPAVHWEQEKSSQKGKEPWEKRRKA